MKNRPHVVPLLVLVFLTGGLSMATNAHAQEPTSFRIEREIETVDGLPAREVTLRVDHDGLTDERTIVEVASLNGGSTQVSAVQDASTRRSRSTTERTRQEFVIDPNGRQRVAAALSERRLERPDGTLYVERQYSESDVNGRAYALRREEETTVPRGQSRFQTKIEVSEPSLGRRGFVATERIERSERRNGPLTVELDQTTYRNPGGAGAWSVSERRVLNRDPRNDQIRAVELVYRADDSGDLVLNDRIVSREWTTASGRQHRTEEVFTTSIPNEVRTARPRLFQRIKVLRSPRSSGGWLETRTVSEPRNGHLRIVEEAVERARVDGRGERVVERELRQLDINGRLAVVSVSRIRESTD